MRNGKKSEKIVAGVIIILVIVWLGYTYSQKSNTGETIRIGAAFALTGKSASYGEWTKNGMELALKKINSQNDIKISVIYEDTQSDIPKAVAACNKLISIDRVPVIIGPVSSSEIMACAPVAESAKVVLFNTLGSSDKIKDAGDYVFRIRESTVLHGERMAEYAFNKLGIKTAGILYANAENGISYAESFRNKLNSLGGTIVFDESYLEKQTDFKTAITKLKEKNPQVIYIAGLATEMGIILKQAKEMSVVKTVFLASAGAENPILIEIAGSTANGLILTTPAFNLEQQDINIKNFAEDYKNLYGEQPNFSAALGYDGIMVLYDVLKKFGFTSEKIKEGLYQTKNFPGIGGAFSFDEFGEVSKPIIFKKVINGEFSIIE